MSEFPRPDFWLLDPTEEATRMTRLSEIQTRLNAATPGPWSWAYSEDTMGDCVLHYDGVGARPGGGTMTRCPTCTSPAPHLHPAMQHGGEVQPCPDGFHRRVTSQNTPARIAGTERILALTAAVSSSGRPEGER